MACKMSIGANKEPLNTKFNLTKLKRNMRKKAVKKSGNGIQIKEINKFYKKNSSIHQRFSHFIKIFI